MNKVTAALESKSVNIGSSLQNVSNYTKNNATFLTTQSTPTGKTSLKVWMRDLQIKLSSSETKQVITYGNQWSKGKQDLDISITGSKYLSSLKDTFTITIKNLTYKQILELIMYKFYNVEILAGYRSLGGAKTIFSGSVIYISTKKENNNVDNTCYILCGSKFMASYGQSRMNLTLNSGINMYAAIKWVCKMNGINDSLIQIDESFKNKLVKEVTSVNNTSSSFIETLCSSNNFVVNTDSTYGNVLTVLNSYKTNQRVITLTNDKILLVGGYPKIDKNGFKLTVFPTYQFMPCDVIMIDNSILDLSVSSYSSGSDLNNSNYINEDGKYMIYQIDYSLSNKDNDFTLTLYAKNRDLYNNITGVQGYGNY